MCTISFLPVDAARGEFILTSNRDEAITRKTLKPEVYLEEGQQLLYPKDAVAGGTWIGLSERKRIVCLMNGAFKKHERKPPYQKSRGVVVKNLLTSADLLSSFATEELDKTEPFTCIVVEWQNQLELHQLVWDGEKKHSSLLPLRNHIWGSSFLYSSEVRQGREKSFQEFIKNKKPEPNGIMSFHSFKGDNDNEGLIIDKGLLKTCSITQIIRKAEVSKMVYKDLLLEGKPVFETSVKF